jgi:diaminopimelate epimerase
VQGGDELSVNFKEHGGSFEGVRLTGPATFVFEGRIDV